MSLKKKTRKTIHHPYLRIETEARIHQRLPVQLEARAASPQPGCHHLTHLRCRHVFHLNVVFSFQLELNRTLHQYVCVMTGRLALLFQFYGLILPENQSHTLSYVFTLWSSLSISSKICSSSENPPIFGLSPPEFSSCLTKPTSLFTPRHPPHTLLTYNWHVFNS